MKTISRSLESSSSSAATVINPLGTPVQHPNGGWMPRRWNDELAGCVFLPRTLDKARRVLQGEREGRDLMNGYLFGDLDYADGRILRFLCTNEIRVLELLRELDDDAAVATVLIRESRRSSGEIKAWSRRFRRVNRLFGAMWDADEGRRPLGWLTSLLNGFYNRVMMPPVYCIFHMQSERRRRGQGST